MAIEISLGIWGRMIILLMYERFYNAAMATFADHICIFRKAPQDGLFCRPIGLLGALDSAGFLKNNAVIDDCCKTEHLLKNRSR